MTRKRAAVKRRLTEIGLHVFADPVLLLAEGFVGTAEESRYPDGLTEQVVVRYHWDAGVVNVPTLFLGITAGPNDPAGMKRTDARSDDRFTIGGYLATPGFQPDDEGAMAAEEAAERAADLYLAAVLGTHGLVDADIASVMDPADYLLSKVTVTDVDGPYHGFPAPQSHGSISGGVTFTVDCTAVLT